MPSRLKGIETLELLGFSASPLCFGYAFPFEVNWNTCFPPSDSPGTIRLWICLPVWRELKPLGVKWKVFHFTSHFGYAFPFEVNWNIKYSVFRQSLPSAFGYAFPFEGNWNSSVQPGTPMRGIALDMPSRLKGIETQSLLTSYEKSLCFGYAFPFEGNWNLLAWSAGVTLSSTLSVPSRLKGIETMHTPFRRKSLVDFVCAFPFEGNGNIITRNNRSGTHKYGTLSVPSRLKGIIVDPENKFTFYEIYVSLYDYDLFNRFTQTRAWFHQ